MTIESFKPTDIWSKKLKKDDIYLNKFVLELDKAPER